MLPSVSASALSDYTAKESREVKLNVELGRGRDNSEDVYLSSSVIYDQVKGEGGEHFAMNDNVSYSTVAVLNT